MLGKYLMDSDKMHRASRRASPMVIAGTLPKVTVRLILRCRKLIIHVLWPLSRKRRPNPGYKVSQTTCTVPSPLRLAV